VVSRVTWGGVAWTALGLAILAASGAQAQNATAPVVVAPPAKPLTVADGQAIEEALAASPELAFPAGLRGGPQALANPNVDIRTSADAAFSKAAVTLAQDEHGLLPDPLAVDPNWALRAPYDASADFAAARAKTASRPGRRVWRGAIRSIPGCWRRRGAIGRSAPRAAGRSFLPA